MKLYIVAKPFDEIKQFLPVYITTHKNKAQIFWDSYTDESINLIFAFLAISQTLTIILAAIAAISLVASLVISIKNDVINRPTCLGREKSFIDLSQNKEAKKEVPDQIKSMKKMSTSILDDK